MLVICGCGDVKLQMVVLGTSKPSYESVNAACSLVQLIKFKLSSIISIAQTRIWQISKTSSWNLLVFSGKFKLAHPLAASNARQVVMY